MGSSVVRKSILSRLRWRWWWLNQQRQSLLMMGCSFVGCSFPRWGCVLPRRRQRREQLYRIFGCWHRFGSHWMSVRSLLPVRHVPHRRRRDVRRRIKRLCHVSVHHFLKRLGLPHLPLEGKQHLVRHAALFFQHSTHSILKLPKRIVFKFVAAALNSFSPLDPRIYNSISPLHHQHSASRVVSLLLDSQFERLLCCSV